jgi:hypothetical protein
VLIDSHGKFRSQGLKRGLGIVNNTDALYRKSRVCTKPSPLSANLARSDPVPIAFFKKNVLQT